MKIGALLHSAARPAGVPPGGLEKREPNSCGVSGEAHQTDTPPPGWVKMTVPYLSQKVPADYLQVPWARKLVPQLPPEFPLDFLPAHPELLHGPFTCLA